MIRVLVVDDDFMVAQIHARHVQRVEGFEVVGTAHSGREALEQVEALKPDLVVLDLFLPDISGQEVLRRIRALGLGTDVIVISAAREAAEVQQAVRAGVVDYLLKPFRMERLHEALERYRGYRSEMPREGEVEQAEIDRLYALVRRREGFPALPKGIDPLTLGRIETALQAAGEPVGVETVAAAAGVSRSTAQRYLRYLADAGRVEVSPVYGTVGRPERSYRWIGPKG